MNLSPKSEKHLWILIALTVICVSATGAWALTQDEENNIKIYRTASKGVVNITSIVMERDFFQGIVPREGAGSGSVIDTDGRCFTNRTNKKKNKQKAPSMMPYSIRLGAYSPQA